MVAVYLCGRDDSTTSASSLPSSGGGNAAGTPHHRGLPDPAEDVVPRHPLPAQRGTTPGAPHAGTESVNVSDEFLIFCCLSLLLATLYP